MKTTSNSSKKRELTAEERDECGRLNAIYQTKKKWLKGKGFKNQEDIGAFLGMGQAGVSHYLNGVNALNKEVAARWAELLEVEVSTFSVRLADEIRSLTRAGHVETGVLTDQSSNPNRTTNDFARRENEADAEIDQLIREVYVRRKNLGRTGILVLQEILADAQRDVLAGLKPISDSDTE